MPQQIIECICNVQNWWAADVKGSTKNLGDVFTVRFGKTYSVFKITELTSTKIKWLVTASYLPLFKNETEWLNTQIIFEILPSDNSYKIIMTHVGLTPACACYVDCNKGWNFYVGESLKKLITENKGLPGAGIFTHISNDKKRYDGLLYLKTESLPQLNGEYVLIDVKATEGERVTSFYSIQKLNAENFSANDLKGEYYMLIENKPLYENIQPLEDIQQIITQ